MQRSSMRFTGITVLALAVLPLLAADTNATKPDMMQRCLDHCRATKETIDKTMQALDAVKNSDDISKMKSALGEARRQLSGMKEHVTDCTMLMEKMHRGDTSANGESPEDALISAYFEAERLLVDDKFESVAGRFEKMRQAAQKLDDSENSPVHTEAKQILQAATAPKNIDGAREQFKAVSKPLLALVEKQSPSKTVASSLYEAYCPMVKASWLQSSKEISNPYMGQSMPNCGSIKRTIK